jgi:hypothetical protein
MFLPAMVVLLPDTCLGAGRGEQTRDDDEAEQ